MRFFHGEWSASARASGAEEGGGLDRHGRRLYGRSRGRAARKPRAGGGSIRISAVISGSGGVGARGQAGHDAGQSVVGAKGGATIRLPRRRSEGRRRETPGAGESPAPPCASVLAIFGGYLLIVTSASSDMRGPCTALSSRSYSASCSSIICSETRRLIISSR